MVERFECLNRLEVQVFIIKLHNKRILRKNNFKPLDGNRVYPSTSCSEYGETACRHLLNT